jgi:hypothetical protein
MARAAIDLGSSVSKPSIDGPTQEYPPEKSAEREAE